VAVRLRLMRTGRRGAPSYRIVAIDSRKKRDGKFLEILGHYNPRTEPADIGIKEERIRYWLGVGAQPSETVRSLLRKAGLLAKLDQERRDAYLREALERRSVEEQKFANETTLEEMVGGDTGE
jgi:small subunit ribosomal protein S16